MASAPGSSAMHRAAPARPCALPSRSPIALSQSIHAFGSVKNLELLRNRLVPAITPCARRQLAIIDDKLSKARAEQHAGSGVARARPASAPMRPGAHLARSTALLPHDLESTDRPVRPARSSSIVTLKPRRQAPASPSCRTSASMSPFVEPKAQRHAEAQLSKGATLEAILGSLDPTWFEHSVKRVQSAWASSKFDPLQGSRGLVDDATTQRDLAIFQAVPRPHLVLGEAATLQHRFRGPSTLFPTGPSRLPRPAYSPAHRVSPPCMAPPRLHATSPPQPEAAAPVAPAEPEGQVVEPKWHRAKEAGAVSADCPRLSSYPEAAAAAAAAASAAIAAVAAG